MLALFGDMSVPCALRYLEAALEALLGASSKGREAPAAPLPGRRFVLATQPCGHQRIQASIHKTHSVVGRLTGFYREVSHR